MAKDIIGPESFFEIFVDADLVMRYNFLTGKKEKIFDFICDFTEQPEFFIFNED